MPRPLLLAASLLFGAGAFAWLQGSTPHLVDRDSYYHARYSEMLPERGLSRGFEWARESVWRDRFSDKELLFHAWLAPFCREGRLVGGAKLGAWLLGCGVMGALALVLVGHGIRFPWFWLALVPALGNHFLFRMQAVRPQLLSVLLLLLGIHFLLQARWRWLAALGFLYSWSYAAPHLLVAFALIDALARGAVDRRFEWRGLAASAGGVAAGLLFHPYSPNSLEMWWIVNVKIIGRAWDLGGDVALRLGSEFEPILPRSLVVSSTLVLLCLLGTFAGAVFGGPLSRRSKLLAAYLVGGFLLYCMSARFIEYFAPLALLAAASVAGDLWPAGWTRRRAAAAAAAGLLALGLAGMSLRDARRAVSSYPGPDLAGAAGWIRRNVPPGETIVHLDWGDFVQLFHFDPTHRYLVGLDPMFMYVERPDRLRLIEDVKNGRWPLDPQELARTFGSRFLVARSRLRPVVEASPLRPVYEDEGAAVYRLAE